MSEAAVSWQSVQPGVVLILLHRPPANALGTSLLDGLRSALDAAEKAGNTKVVVIGSEIPGFFAAGADIKQMSTIDAASFTAYGDKMRAVNDCLSAGSVLSIAAIDGLALGGGLELAMACTMRVSGPRARFGLPEVKIGLIPGAGGTQRLPRLVGRGRAIDIMVTGRQVSAQEAHRIGLVDRLAEEEPPDKRPGSEQPGSERTDSEQPRTFSPAIDLALELAAELRKASLPAQLAAVRSIDAAFDLSFADGMLFEVQQEQDLFEHGEAAEGISAFVEKRRPRFA